MKRLGKCWSLIRFKGGVYMFVVGIWFCCTRVFVDMSKARSTATFHSSQSMNKNSDPANKEFQASKHGFSVTHTEWKPEDEQEQQVSSIKGENESFKEESQRLENQTGKKSEGYPFCK